MGFVLFYLDDYIPRLIVVPPGDPEPAQLLLVQDFRRALRSELCVRLQFSDGGRHVEVGTDSDFVGRESSHSWYLGQ